MTSDQLFLALCRLRESAQLAQTAKRELRVVAALPDYRQWQASLAQMDPFQVPEKTGCDTLRVLGLVRGTRLEVRVNTLRDDVFVTDGVWVDPSIRAFPFSDESEMLVRHARALGWDVDADAVYDLACGCGHSGLSFSAARQVLLDINPRALTYVDINKELNGHHTQSYLSVLNDIRSGMPPDPVRHARHAVLVLANMPFAPAPSKSALPLTSNGGQTGLDLQQATFKAIRELRAAAPERCSVRALVMGMTLGNARTGKWELADMARDAFGPRDQVRWRLLTQETLLRLDGKRALANPSPVRTALPAIAGCRLYNPSAQLREERRRLFTQLADQHHARGATDMAFGIVEVEVN